MHPLTQEKVLTGLRYAGVGTATTLTVLTTLGALSPEQSQAAIADIHQVVDGLSEAVGGFAKLYYVLWPVVAIYLAKVGISSTDISKRLAAIVKAASSDTTDGDAVRAQLQDAVAKVVAAPPVAK